MSLLRKWILCLGVLLLLLSPAQAEQDREPKIDRIFMGDLQLVTDFHPETDRWTEKNNRVRISSWTGAWFFSTDLDVRTDLVTGIRVSWEVPGFIGIRLDSGIVGWSRAEVRGTVNNVTSRRTADGIVHAHTLSLGIFNPELSVVPGLALWAGFGGGLFVFDYDEPSSLGGVTIDDDLEDISLSGNVFLELDYEIQDVFHLGIAFRQHFLFGGNDGAVSEVTLNLSVLL